MNPVEELTALALAQQDLIDRLGADKARRHAEFIQAQSELVAAKQQYLRILKPRWDFVDGKLTKDPNWKAPSDATRQAHQNRIERCRDAVTARSAAATVANTALAQARAALEEMRAAWPAVLGPFPVTDPDPPGGGAS